MWGNETGSHWQVKMCIRPATCSVLEQVRHPAGLPRGSQHGKRGQGVRLLAGPHRSLAGGECPAEQRTPRSLTGVGPLTPRQAGCSSPRAPPQIDAAPRGCLVLTRVTKLQPCPWEEPVNSLPPPSPGTRPHVPRRSRQHRSPAQCTAGHWGGPRRSHCGEQRQEIGPQVSG